MSKSKPRGAVSPQATEALGAVLQTLKGDHTIEGRGLLARILEGEEPNKVLEWDGRRAHPSIEAEQVYLAAHVLIENRLKKTPIYSKDGGSAIQNVADLFGESERKVRDAYEKFTDLIVTTTEKT